LAGKIEIEEKTSEKIICYHCGDFCKDDSIEKDGKYFCCTGCLYVHELLSDSNLNDFYSLTKSSGLKPKNFAKDEFAFLDDEEIKEKMLHYTIGGTSKVTLFIPEVYCSACIWLLENLYRLNRGIIESNVNFLRKEITITFKSNVTSLREIVELLTSIGYRPKLSVSDLDNIKQKNPNKPLYIKLGIAGFAFGNIMLLALPEYFSGGNLSDIFKIFIGYLSLFLGTMVLYSASDYFQSAWTSLKLRHINIDVPISIGILTLFLRSAFDIITGVGPGFFDSMTGLVFFLLIGKVFQQKTFYSLSFDRDFKSYFPLSVIKKEGFDEKFISLKDINIGDRLLIRSNEIIPTDAVLLSDAATIDYSFVTGESKPVTVNRGEKIFAGGKQLGSSIEIEATKEFYQSYLTELWNHQSFKEKEDESKVSQISDVAAKYFTFGVLFIALCTLGYWLMIDVNMAINNFTAVLIIACPCALALTIPFTYGTSLREYSKKNLFLKNDSIVEKISKITTIVFDKTGTLTDVSKSRVVYSGQQLSEREIVLIRSVAKNSTHPLSRLIYEHFEETPVENINDYTEKEGKGIEAIYDGNIVKIGNFSWVKGILTENRINLSENNFNFKTESNVYVSINDVIIGYFRVVPRYRDNLKEMFDQLKDKYKLYVISGDNDSEKDILNDITGNSAELFFNQLPEQKLQFIEKLQQNGEKVMMVGDGLNDAGALKQSEVGIAVADNNSSFTPGSEAILLSDDLTLLPGYLKLSQKAMQTVYISFAISFVYNIVGMVLAVQGILSPLIAAVFMPVSSINVVLFTVTKVKFDAKLLNIFKQGKS
jgi:P-type Cu+ transporter